MEIYRCFAPDEKLKYTVEYLKKGGALEVPGREGRGGGGEGRGFGEPRNGVGVPGRKRRVGVHVNLLFLKIKIKYHNSKFK